MSETQRDADCGWVDQPLTCVGCGRQTVRPPKAPRTGDLKGALTGGCKWCKGDLA